MRTAKIPELQLRDFLFRFWRGGLFLRLIAGRIAVEPFADVVGDYTCHNRDQKGENIIHAFTPFLASIGSGNKPIISFFSGSSICIIVLEVTFVNIDTFIILKVLEKYKHF